MRTLKLLLNFFFSALLFTFQLMVLILLLNHQVKPGAHGAWLMFLNLFGYYGPAWFFFILIAFFIGQFFSVRRYPIGFIRPPTLIYVFSFTILVLSVIIYLNWNFYHDFFSPAVTLKFFLLLTGNTLLVLAGGLFALLHGRRKTWLLVLFGALLTVQVLVNLQLVASRHESQPLPSAYSAASESPRKLMIVIMDGLSLNTLQTMADEQKLLNFNWIRENGVVGRLTTFKPDFELSLLNTLLSGCPPSAYDVHSDFKYQFKNLPREFDISPRYLFFRFLGIAKRLGLIRFYKRTERQPLDQIFQLYQANGFASLRRLQPVLLPVYTERGLKHNNTFIQFFSAALGQVDKKMDILKKAFFCDDLLSRELPRFRADEYKYFLFFFPGLEKVVTHFYHYAWPEEFGNVDVRRVQKYGWVVERYYQYYDSLIGKLIGSMGDDELLVVLGFAEPEPLDLWQRILINYLGRKDVFVWTNPRRAQGTILFYEKSALKKQLFLDAVSLVDVFPTLIYYAGFPLSRELKGEVIRDIFSEEFLFRNPVFSNKD